MILTPARWFNPSLGRFLSPDTIVPTSTQGTQAWDRYAFVNNNPVRYTDPTGHVAAEDDGPPPADDPCIKYGQSSPECQAAVPPVDLPETIVLHPLDDKIVAQIPIYDTSTPPKIIGYT